VGTLFFWKKTQKIRCDPGGKTYPLTRMGSVGGRKGATVVKKRGERKGEKGSLTFFPGD